MALEAVLVAAPDATVGPATAGDLVQGDWALFDPIYGLERVISTQNVAIGRWGNWTAKHIHVWNGHLPQGSRFIIRFNHEPVLRLVGPEDCDPGENPDRESHEAQGTS